LKCNFRNFRVDPINLSGLPNLEFLELRDFKFDLTEYDPFVNLNKLRHLILNKVQIENAKEDFLKRFSKLEKFQFSKFRTSYHIYKSRGQEITTLKFDTLSSLKYLTFLSLDEEYRPFDFDLESLDFLKNMTSLVVIKFKMTMLNRFRMSEDTFEKLINLKHLKIGAFKGKWMKHLTNVEILELEDFDSSADSIDSIKHLTQKR
jgi:predicted DNA-binding protein